MRGLESCESWGWEAVRKANSPSWAGLRTTGCLNAWGAVDCAGRGERRRAPRFTLACHRWQIARPTPAPHTFAIAKTWGEPGKRRFVFVRGIPREIELIPFSIRLPYPTVRPQYLESVHPKAYIGRPDGSSHGNLHRQLQDRQGESQLHCQMQKVV